MLISRRHVLFGAAVVALVGCDQGPAIAAFGSSGGVVRPSGRGVIEPVRVSYRLRRPATVSAVLRAADGKEWPLRPAAARPAGEPHEIAFDGTVPTADGRDRTVLPDGAYELRLGAAEPDGRRDERTLQLKVEGAATDALDLQGPTLSLNLITPDGDGVDDEVRITYALSKAAMVELGADDGEGNRAAIIAPARVEAGEHTAIWDGSAGGRVFGGKRMPDGDYTVTLRAQDDAGNVRTRRAPLRISNGGIERLEIVDASIEPDRLRVGGQLKIRVVVKNTGETTLRTMGPPPGTPYRTDQTFSDVLGPDNKPYTPVSGAWRVALGWEKGSQQLPLRWGILPDPNGTLAPGQTATVEAAVTVTQPAPNGLRFWVGAIREGVGVGTGQVADRVVAIVP